MEGGLCQLCCPFFRILLAVNILRKQIKGLVSIPFPYAWVNKSADFEVDACMGSKVCLSTLSWKRACSSWRSR